MRPRRQQQSPHLPGSINDSLACLQMLHIFITNCFGNCGGGAFGAKSLLAADNSAMLTYMNNKQRSKPIADSDGSQSLGIAVEGNRWVCLNHLCPKEKHDDDEKNTKTNMMPQVMTTMICSSYMMMTQMMKHMIRL